MHPCGMRFATFVIAQFYFWAWRLCAASSIVQTYVINLARRPDRLENIKWQFDALHKSFIRFDAIDGVKFRDESENGTRSPFSFHPSTKVDLVHTYEYCKKRDFWGVFGCWQSHLQVYFSIIKCASLGEKDGPVLILEDDVELEADVFDYLDEVIPKLPRDWDVFFVGYYDPEPPIQKDLPFSKVNKVWCAHAYVVRDTATVFKIIKLSNTVRMSITDYVLNKGMKKGILVGYAASPDEYIVQNRSIFTTDIPTSGFAQWNTLRKPIRKP